MAFRKSGKPGLLLFYVMVDCILWKNAINRLIVMKLDVVLQLGKIVAGIEQKPVSLDDIVTYGALIKNERDYWMSARHWL